MGQSTKRHIGRLLLDGGFLSQESLDYALQEQEGSKELLGQVLVRIGLLSTDEVKLPLIVQEHLRSIDDAVQIAAGERQLLGTLLVQSGYVSNRQLDYVISEQRRTGEKLGEVFKRFGLLNELQLKGLLDFQVSQEDGRISPLRLGELLVATGQITRGQLDDSIRRQALSAKKLGEVLVESGYASTGSVNYCIRLQKMLVNAVLASIIAFGVGTECYAVGVPDTESQSIVRSVLDESGEFSRLSAKESELFRLVNEYRESNGLPPVANSRSLNKVARMHAIDLVENNPATGKDSRGLDCSLHSWSNSGSWTPVCYTKDHANAKAMWDKPREITNFSYSGDGYENSYATSEAEVNPANVVRAWSVSTSHNALILESGIWKRSNMLAFGVGVYKNVAVMWFGSLSDPLGPMPANEVASK